MKPLLDAFLIGIMVIGSPTLATPTHASTPSPLPSQKATITTTPSKTQTIPTELFYGEAFATILAIVDSCFGLEEGDS